MIDFYTSVHQRYNRIYYRGYDSKGRYSRHVDYQPYLFVPTDTDTPYKTIDGQKVGKIQFSSISEAKEFQKQYKEVKNYPFYGLNHWVYTFINDKYPDNFDYDTSKIKIVSLDIEVYSSGRGFPSPDQATSPISAITLACGKDSITFGLADVNPEVPNNNYIYFETEEHMLKRFLEIWNQDVWAPDIVTGWNVERFDIVYLINRITNLLGGEYAKRLSPHKIIEPRDISNDFSGKEKVYDIAGIAILDYLQLYKKFTYTNHESYSLDNISKYELGQAKLDYSDYQGLDDLYERNPKLYMEYNIRDTLLVDRLEHKLNFIQQVITIAYMAKVNYVDALATARPWDVIIHNRLLKQGIVIPQYKKGKVDRELIGGYVKSPHLGMYKWVVSFDFDSLYPSIIMQHNISPDTFYKKINSVHPEEIIKDNLYPVNENPSKYCMTANGAMYRKDIKGFIPEVVGMMIEQRFKAKKEMIELKKKDKNNPKIKKLNNYQQALKILCNGLYGAISMIYFRWFDINLAESVTSTAQTSTRYVEKRLNEYLNKLLKTEGVDYCVHCDTDSVYLNLERLVVSCGLEGQPTDRVVEFLDKVCAQKLQPFIKRCCAQLGETYSVYTPKLNMKRENIADKGIWRGAKMYILNVWDSEGVRYKEPELKMTGIEAVRSSTPMVCRDKIKAALKVIMNEDEKSLQKFVAEFKKEFFNLPFDAVAFPRGVKGLQEYQEEGGCKKGTPIHVRASLIYNTLIEGMELTKKYQLIKDNDKIRFSYLKDPNPIQSHVIGCPDTLPPEFELEEYIDYQTQFEKTFLLPIQSITNIIGWHTNHTTTLKGLLH